VDMKKDLFVGIDVAFAKKKKLPICIATTEKNRLVPLPLNEYDLPPVPRGSGNVATLDHETVKGFAASTLSYLQEAERVLDGSITAVAIDAPSSYARGERRKCEQAMDGRGISCFATPSRQRFAEIEEKVRTHLRDGQPQNRLPHANQLWMLAGFALFDVLGNSYRCLEVFPQSIVHTLGVANIHKSKREGAIEQLTAVCRRTGWSSPDQLLLQLPRAVAAPLHDQVDAFMCAWIASLYPGGLTACGEPPDDVIWIPSIERPEPKGVLERMRRLLAP